MIKIKTALISVSDKTGIVGFAKFLASGGVRIISTGGTHKALSDAGVDVVDVSEVTHFPEIMDGRVKTLHPKVHGGILAVREDAEHRQAMELHEIGEIDMVVVNLYPFEETVAKGAEFEETIENIDIGGPSMIRSAAKNHKYVAVVTDPSDYKALQTDLDANDMHISRELSTELAAKAFARTASYDTAIANWFDPNRLSINAKLKQKLRYGENPHQEASFYTYSPQVLEPSVANANQLQGKELSYNNINDTDAAWLLVNEFKNQPTVAIIKHANPCGVAVAGSLKEAYVKAFEADSTSAFGGIVALNAEVDGDTAEEIAKIFTEVIIAPGFSVDAKEIFAKKKNLRLLETGGVIEEIGGQMIKSVIGGLLVQDLDNAEITEADLEVVTERKPSSEEVADLLFAFKVCKHVKSNAIVVAKDGVTTGIGAGQMNRVGSMAIACAGDVKGHVVASDAFFPFPDNIDIASEAGLTAAIQPGGSVKDQEVIEAANKAGMAMVFTGKRSFKH